MQTWRRLPLTLLALLAMFAIMLPQTLWACPMNGRVASAARVCEGIMPMVAGEMPCAESGNQCCKPLTVPASQGDDSHSNPAFTAQNQAPTVFAVALPAFEVVPLVVPTSQTLQSPAERLYLTRFTNSPPPFWTQYRPLNLAGRAPPVL